MTGLTVSLAASDQAQHLDGARWAGFSGVRGPKWAKLPLLTVGGLGMQVLWSVEMGYGEHFIKAPHSIFIMFYVVYVAAPPYLISLGLSKSLMSLVFVAGPFSSLF